MEQKVLLIIPAFNESGNIENLTTLLSKDYNRYDFIVINDCSTDKTGEILDRLHVPHLDLPINLGIGGAVQAGYKYAKKHDYDIAIQFDGDGQHDPAFIEKLLEALTSCDMAIGSRFIENKGFQSSKARRAGIAVFRFLAKILIGQKITDPTSGLRACNKRIISDFAKNYPSDYPEPETIISVAKAGYKIKEVPVVMKERKGGVSSINMVKSAYYMLKVSVAMLISSTVEEEA